MVDSGLRLGGWWWLWRGLEGIQVELNLNWVDYALTCGCIWLTWVDLAFTCLELQVDPIRLLYLLTGVIIVMLLLFSYFPRSFSCFGAHDQFIDMCSSYNRLLLCVGLNTIVQLDGVLIIVVRLADAHSSSVLVQRVMIEANHDSSFDIDMKKTHLQSLNSYVMLARML